MGPHQSKFALTSKCHMALKSDFASKCGRAPKTLMRSGVEFHWQIVFYDCSLPLICACNACNCAGTRPVKSMGALLLPMRPLPRPRPLLPALPLPRPPLPCPRPRPRPLPSEFGSSPPSSLSFSMSSHTARSVLKSTSSSLNHPSSVSCWRGSYLTL